MLSPLPLHQHPHHCIHRSLLRRHLGLLLTPHHNNRTSINSRPRHRKLTPSSHTHPPPRRRRIRNLPCHPNPKPPQVHIAGGPRSTSNLSRRTSLPNRNRSVHPAHRRAHSRRTGACSSISNRCPTRYPGGLPPAHNRSHSRKTKGVPTEHPRTASSTRNSTSTTPVPGRRTASTCPAKITPALSEKSCRTSNTVSGADAVCPQATPDASTPASATNRSPKDIRTNRLISPPPSSSFRQEEPQ